MFGFVMKSEPILLNKEYNEDLILSIREPTHFYRIIS